MKAPFVVIIVTLIFPVAGMTEDRIELERSTVVGNSESPKALFIAPWRQVVSGEVAGLKVETLLDDALEPIDRPRFNQQLDLHQIVNSDAAKR